MRATHTQIAVMEPVVHYSVFAETVDVPHVRAHDLLLLSVHFSSDYGSTPSCLWPQVGEEKAMKPYVFIRVNGQTAVAYKA